MSPTLDQMREAQRALEALRRIKREVSADAWLLSEK